MRHNFVGTVLSGSEASDRIAKSMRIGTDASLPLSMTNSTFFFDASLFGWWAMSLLCLRLNSSYEQCRSEKHKSHNDKCKRVCRPARPYNPVQEKQDANQTH